MKKLNHSRHYRHFREILLISLLMSGLSFLSGCNEKGPSNLLGTKYGAAGMNQSCVGPGVTDGREFFQDTGVGIIKGSRLTSTSRFANRLVIVSNKLDDGSSQTLCTGALLPNNVILTAGHCAADDLRQLNVTFTFSDSCSGVRSPSRDKKFKVDRVIFHPSYNKEDPNSEGNGLNSNLKNFNFDLALLHFKGTAPEEYQPLDLPREDLDITSFSRYILMGFGKDESNSSGQLKITSLTQDHLRNYYPGRRSIHLTQSKTGICFGDSGSPVLAIEDNNILIIGITSSVSKTTDEDPCQQGSVFVSTSYYSTWIKRAYREILISKSGI